MNALISPKTVALAAPMFSSAGGVAGALAVRASSEVASIRPTWGDEQIASLQALQRVVDEGFVFGAVTGSRNSGKSRIVAELLASVKSDSRVCVDIRTPHQISKKTAEALDQAISKAVEQSTNEKMHILIVVDNAHTATRELLDLLNRFAASRSSANSPQIVLAGEPELWEVLGSRYYAKLLRRIALRCSLDERPPHTVTESNGPGDGSDRGLIGRTGIDRSASECQRLN